MIEFDTHCTFLLVLPEITIQTSLSRFSSQMLLNCTIISRPLSSAKWKRYGNEINNIKRVDINDYTIVLILSLQVNKNLKLKKINRVL
jgi:hypothetical protein